ncbi:MAG: hypothetical protein U0842_03645 [Candidatus Binatia bacterium]
MSPAGRAVRRVARWTLVLLALALAATVALRFVARLSGGPLGIVPGGRLDGPLAGNQSPDWSFTDRVRTIQVEVDPEDPLSVTTWVFTLDGDLYVAADFFNPFKQWPRRALVDPRVRLRIDGSIYERLAVRVTDPATIERLRRAIAVKYDIADGGLASKIDVWFFRMDPRPAVISPPA